MRLRKKAIVITTMLIAIVALLMTGCAAGISEEDYNSVVAERDQARAEVASSEKEFASLEKELAVEAAIAESLRLAKEVAEEKAGEKVAALETEVASLKETIKSLKEAAASGGAALLLEITIPEDGVRLTDSPVIVSGVTNPEATITVNDVEVEVAEDGTFSTEVELVQFEASVITVVATLGEQTVTKEITLKSWRYPGDSVVAWEVEIK